MPGKQDQPRPPQAQIIDNLFRRRSDVHGTGVYTRRRIPKGSRIVEYTGKVIPAKKAEDLGPADPENPYHTFYYLLDNGDVIDARRGGNIARWINHSCAPNCTTEEEDSRIFIHALRTIYPGEELFYDYSLDPGERRTKRVEKNFACFCGAAECRGTMLEAK
jgi:hypothetical protein